MSIKDIKIVDRTTMTIYFDKKYATHEKRPPLKTIIVITDVKVEDLPRIIRKKRKLSKQYFAKVVSLGPEFYRVTLQRTIGLRQIRKDVLVDAGCKVLKGGLAIYEAVTTLAGIFKEEGGMKEYGKDLIAKDFCHEVIQKYTKPEKNETEGNQSSTNSTTP